MNNCPLCSRAADFSNDHHLIPVSKGGKIKVEICVPCRNTLHDLFTNNELRDTYNTVEAIQAHPRFQKYLKWIKNKPLSFMPCFKAKK
jgi:hypothetical protein